ncbi:histidine phosphatase family protein [Nostocoides sp. HKS02]|uniref:histidine phosphatase family protein n=1 Tax=Nostocoides sp. HKS02 TaxID=1813880 RepID=UPI0012B48E8E|nr:histidine phosphatase family protein [Tetrasphaera sp. HKS02]QGN57743.1 histidine phosphatase family protein [Tetrasphaera sp. HKS02]
MTPAGQPSPGRSARRVIVLRHGETDHNARGVWQGQLDSDLSGLGREQARAAAAALAAYQPSLVVASDLKRAAETGDEVARLCDIPISYDARWREIHVGEWAGMTAAEVNAEYPEERLRHLRGEDFKRGVHGESLSDVAQRVRSGLDDLLDDLGPGQTAVVATHGVTGRVVIAELVDLDRLTAWRVLGGFGNCHWAEVVEAETGWRIQTWNASASS